MNWNLTKTAQGPCTRGPVVVVVLDGVGLGPRDAGDAVWLARTPLLDFLSANFPYRTLRAHGTAVGLPDDTDMGNSEVGHNAIGAGRIFDQGAKLVNRALQDGSLFRGADWKALLHNCLGGQAPLHFIGLLSDGNVHSHISHLETMIHEAARAGIHRLFVHPLLDGRDVPATSALQYVDRLEAVLALYDGAAGRVYRIASGGGRMTTTMDRYQADWRIVERGWNAHVHGLARRFPSATAAIRTFREEEEGVGDQFLPAFVVTDPAGEPLGRIEDGASVIFFNFRGDRAIEISRAFEDDTFPYFDRGRRPQVLYAGMMQYDGDFAIPRRFLVPPPAIDRTMGEYLAHNGVPQLACSETQKFGHVTYFWNGNRGGKFDDALETYIEVPSDLIPFEQRPWMKAAEITDAVCRELASGAHRFARVNYANGDMVGHTGSLDAAVLAVEAVDLSLTRLCAALRALEGVALITADHGNADEMFEHDKKGAIQIDPLTGAPRARTSHSLNPVPFIVYDPTHPGRHTLRTDLPSAGLANIAATALRLLGYHPPEGYEPSLLAVD